MNQAYLHLLTNHLPTLGSLLGMVVLAYGIFSRSDPTRSAAYLVLLLSALGGVVAYLSGEAAEEAVEDLAAGTINSIEPHEEFAKFTLIAFIVVGILALAGMFITAKKARFARPFALIVLLLSLVGFGLAAWTAYLGGQIRHTEIHGTVAGDDGGKEED